MWTFQQFVIFPICIALFLMLDTVAIPPTSSTSTSKNYHIVSYIKQKKFKPNLKEFSEFDHETIKGNPNINNSQNAAYLQNRDVIHIQRLYRNSTIPTTTENYPYKITDDLRTASQNTLDNAEEIFGNNEQHEGQMNSTTNQYGEDEWNRVKMSISVLEPVKHLLNTVSEGSVNFTITNSNGSITQHQLLGMPTGNRSNSGERMHKSPQRNISTVVETKDERETVSHSTSFQLSDFLGILGSWIWGLSVNFFASIGSASAAVSSSSSNEKSK